MSPEFHLLRLTIRLSELARYSGERGWINRRRRDGREADAGFDPGRALHHILDEAFGPSALKPFRLLVPRNRDQGTIYAYTRLTAERLLAQVAETAPPELAGNRIIDLKKLETKPMPTTWTKGKRLGFDVRIRPVVRIKREMPNPRPDVKPYAAGSEVDAFLVEAQKRHPEERPKIVDGKATPSGMIAAGRDRAAVYRDWLAARLDGAAELDMDRTTMIAFERTRVSRGGASIEGPDAAFHGELTVANPDAFNALLMRGVGRHLSFGFGMLLLRPPLRS